MEKNITGTARIIKHSGIQGWFFSQKNIYKAISFELYVNNQKIADIIANDFRKDILSQHIHPTGKVGFFHHCNIDILDDIYLKFTNGHIYIIQKGIPSDKNIRQREVCIVHIGMHKTGSTSIQHNLYRKKYNNLSYFNLEAENHSIPIFSYFSKHPEQYYIHKRAGRSKDDIEEYNKKIKKLFLTHLIHNENHERFVISGEDISALPEVSVKEFKDFLSPYFKHIKIIAYVRSPGSFISSAFQESIKGGLHTFNPGKHWPGYRQRFEKFDKVFGKENVELIHFNPKNMINNDITSDFLNHIHSINNDFTPIKANKSFSLEAVALFYLLNKYILSKLKEKEKKRTKLISLLNTIGKEKFILNYDVLEPIINRHLHDVEWIEDRIDTKIYHKPTAYCKGVHSEEDFYTIADKTLSNLEKMKYQTLENIINKKNLTYLIDQISRKLA